MSRNAPYGNYDYWYYQCRFRHDNVELSPGEVCAVRDMANSTPYGPIAYERNKNVEYWFRFWKGQWQGQVKRVRKGIYGR